MPDNGYGQSSEMVISLHEDYAVGKVAETAVGFRWVGWTLRIGPALSAALLVRMGPVNRPALLEWTDSVNWLGK